MVNGKGNMTSIIGSGNHITFRCNSKVTRGSSTKVTSTIKTTTINRQTGSIIKCTGSRSYMNGVLNIHAGMNETSINLRIKVRTIHARCGNFHCLKWYHNRLFIGRTYFMLNSNHLRARFIGSDGYRLSAGTYGVTGGYSGQGFAFQRNTLGIDGGLSSYGFLPNHGYKSQTYKFHRGFRGRGNHLHGRGATLTYETCELRFSEYKWVFSQRESRSK